MLQQSTNVSSQKVQLLGSVQLLTRVNETNPPHMLEKHLTLIAVDPPSPQLPLCASNPGPKHINTLRRKNSLVFIYQHPPIRESTNSNQTYHKHRQKRTRNGNCSAITSFPLAIAIYNGFGKRLTIRAAAAIEFHCGCRPTLYMAQK